jgi:hypothetical protein
LTVDSEFFFLLCIFSVSGFLFGFICFLGCFYIFLRGGCCLTSLKPQFKGLCTVDLPLDIFKNNFW